MISLDAVARPRHKPESPNGDNGTTLQRIIGRDLAAARAPNGQSVFVVATLICWAAGIALLLLGRTQQGFDRVMGTNIRAQSNFEQRVRRTKFSAVDRLRWSRWLTLGFAVLLLVLAVGSTVALVVR